MNKYTWPKKIKPTKQWINQPTHINLCIEFFRTLTSLERVALNIVNCKMHFMNALFTVHLNCVNFCQTVCFGLFCSLFL